MKATQANIINSETVLASQLRNDDAIIFDGFIWIIAEIKKAESDPSYYTITVTRGNVREIYNTTEAVTFNAFITHSFYRY